jgi:hypothetical protein
MLLTYFLIDFAIVPVASIITGITLVFYIPHARYFCSIIIIIITTTTTTGATKNCIALKVSRQCPLIILLRVGLMWCKSLESEEGSALAVDF